MQYLSLCKIEQFVEKYIIIQSSLDDLINNCNRIIHDHHITILLPLNAYQESYSLIQQLMISFFTLQPQQDQMNEDQEPKIIIKDNLQSSVKVEIHPVSQQEFLTSLTKFIEYFTQILFEILSQFIQKILVEQIRSLVINIIRIISYNIFTDSIIKLQLRG